MNEDDPTEQGEVTVAKVMSAVPPLPPPLMPPLSINQPLMTTNSLRSSYKTKADDSLRSASRDLGDALVVLRGASFEVVSQLVRPTTVFFFVLLYSALLFWGGIVFALAFLR